jgi:hypothetical protein
MHIKAIFGNWIWISIALVAMLLLALLWVSSRNSDGPSKVAIEITLIPDEWKYPALQLVIDRTGRLHVRKQSGEDFVTLASIDPSNGQAVTKICEQLGAIAHLSGPRFRTSVHPNVMIEHRGFEFGSWGMCWNCRVDYSTGDLWSWIDQELDAVRLDGATYESRSERALILLKELSKEFKISEGTRNQLRTLRKPGITVSH